MHRAAEGGNITVECVFDATGTFKRFCKNKCRNKHDILVEISGSQKQRKERGRYSMDFVEYVTATPYQAVLKTILDVSITHVRLSDSGWYSCTLDAYTFWGGINPQVKAFWIVITEGKFTKRHGSIFSQQCNKNVL
ncbi:hypothetical protein NL108_013230 [Boleophthalmus pectinirostris]|nr:hypothetical protein NL108_013230 [Boleophthalmus pectinirostris]